MYVFYLQTSHDTGTTAKPKAAAIKIHNQDTGGEPASNLVLLEAKFVIRDSIPLMSQVAISGRLNSLESAVTFN